jgi:hypothetical protein
MITSILKGRLGNQLFQIATAYSLAKKYNNTCSFDLTKTRLGGFPIEPVLEYENTIYKNIEINPILYYEYSIYYESDATTFNEIPNISPNLLLDGYFQSEKYFINDKDVIRDFLFINENILGNVKERYNDKLENSLSIHVRRGDYVNLKMTLPETYYFDSIDYIKRRTEINNVFIFSDDIEWCKKVFLGDDFIFIDGNKDYEDLYLMSLCRHNIVSNSSFSWWGSYLNKNETKIVCAPSWWSPSHFEDIYFDGMIKIKIIQ